MLSGSAAPQDAPAEWRRVAELLGMARAQGLTSPDSSAGASGSAERDRETIRSMVTILAEAPALVHLGLGGGRVAGLAGLPDLLGQ